MTSVEIWDEILKDFMNKNQDIVGDLPNLLVLFLSAQKEGEIVFPYSKNVQYELKKRN